MNIYQIALRETTEIYKTSKREGKIIVMLYDGDWLVESVKFGDQVGTYPNTFDAKRLYPYVWGLTSSSCYDDCQWVLISPHDYTYRMKIQDGCCILIDPLTEKVKYQLTSLIMNKLEV